MQRYWKCFYYILRHKFYVFKAGKVCEVSLWRRLKHDWSKFSPREFFPYAEFFYGKQTYRRPGMTGKQSIEAPLKVAENFDRALLGHLHRNDHHFEHWLMLQDGKLVAKAMPEQAWRELCADYLAMEFTLNGNWDAISWYSKNVGNMVIHHETQHRIESLLKRAGARLSKELELKQK